MRTRCPQCDTVFRVTPEQLRFRAGKVRCGHCQAVFNALDTLIEDIPLPPSPPPAAPYQPEPAASNTVAESIPQPPAAEPEPEAPADPTESLAAEAESEPRQPDVWPEVEASQPEATVPEPAPAEPEASTAPEVVEAPAADEPPSEAPPDVEAAAASEVGPDTSADVPAEAARDETPEESTQAAREAGLVAARELAETPGYNRWAAGTLASGSLSGLEAETRQRVTWPFTLAVIVLALVLFAQLAYHFRTEIVQRVPDAAGLFTAFGADIPLPHDANLVSIEASDLQADTARGLLVLQATLKNRAPYAQAWPALELTLTDTHDTVVARRVLYAADYLPRGADPAAFAANGETAIRLWIEAKEVAAAGYRLYVFYP